MILLPPETSFKKRHLDPKQPPQPLFRRLNHHSLVLISTHYHRDMISSKAITSSLISSPLMSQPSPKPPRQGPPSSSLLPHLTLPPTRHQASAKFTPARLRPSNEQTAQFTTESHRMHRTHPPSHSLTHSDRCNHLHLHPLNDAECRQMKHRPLPCQLRTRRYEEINAHQRRNVRDCFQKKDGR